MAGLEIKTPPASEPVTTDEMRTQVRLGSNLAHNTELDRLVTVAREEFESATNRALITQTWHYYLDCWPRYTIKLPRSPFASIVSVKYIDANGAEQTLDTSVYDESNNRDPGLIRLAKSQRWPDLNGQPDQINIEFTCGYGAAASDVPQRIRQAIRMKAAYLFHENRTLGLCMTAQQANSAMRAWNDIVATYKMWRFAS